MYGLEQLRLSEDNEKIKSNKLFNEDIDLDLFDLSNKN